MGTETLRILREGYTLPFVEIPAQAEFNNNASALGHTDFVRKEIQDLLKAGCVLEKGRRPYIVPHEST